MKGFQGRQGVFHRFVKRRGSVPPQGNCSRHVPIFSFFSMIFLVKPKKTNKQQNHETMNKIIWQSILKIRQIIPVNLAFFFFELEAGLPQEWGLQLGLFWNAQKTGIGIDFVILDTWSVLLMFFEALCVILVKKYWKTKKINKCFIPPQTAVFHHFVFFQKLKNS